MSPLKLNARQLLIFVAVGLLSLILVVSCGAAVRPATPSPALPSASLTAASTATPTPFPSPSPTRPAPSPATVTITPSSIPGPATLRTPEVGAVLPQPIPPDQWHFIWSGRTGPCYSQIHIEGPDGRNISARADYYPYGYYQYVYSQTERLPNEALTPWSWSADIICPMGSSHSETRSFSVAPAPGP